MGWQKKGCSRASKQSRPPVHKASTQGQYTRPVHKTSTQGQYTRPVHKASTQGQYTRPVHKASTQGQDAQQARPAARGPKENGGEEKRSGQARFMGFPPIGR